MNGLKCQTTPSVSIDGHQHAHPLTQARLLCYIYTHQPRLPERNLLSQTNFSFFFIFLFFSNLIIFVCAEGCRCASSISEEFRLFLRLELRQSKRKLLQYKVRKASSYVSVCFWSKWNCDVEDKLGTYVCSDSANIKHDWIGLSVMSKHISPKHRTMLYLVKL